MNQPPTVIHPIDAEYTGHRDEKERRRKTREWLRTREEELGFIKESPSVSPDTHTRD
jgi:hypothetical protein